MKKVLIITLLMHLYAGLNAQGKNAEIILFKTECSIQNNMNIVERSFLIQINNRSGEELSDISIPYRTADNIEIVDAYIQNCNGELIRKLKKKEIKESSRYTGYFHVDAFKKTFTLKHNIYPYQIYYKYKTTENEFVVIEDWSPLVYIGYDVKKAVFTLNVPVDYKLKILEKDISGKKEIKEANVSYIWESNYEKIDNDEIFSPSLRAVLPRVIVVPENFTYGVPGNQNTWEEYAKWEYDLNKGLNVLPEGEKLKVERLVEGVDSEKDKVRVLYHYLQDNTRYINVSIGIGGLKPQPASYVVENKYGDCKALSNYMKSILDHIGVESFYTNIYAGDVIAPFDTAFAFVNFNHVIVNVPLKNDTLWLECTSKSSPFNYVGTFIQGRYTLPIKEDNVKLIKTPSLKHDDVKEEGKYEIKLVESLASPVKVSYTFRGEKFEEIKGVQMYLDNKEQDNYFRKLSGLKNINAINYSVKQKHRDSAFVNIDYSFQLQNYIKKYGDYRVFEMLEMDIPRINSPKNRELPVQIDFPICIKNEYLYELPVGYEIEKSFSDTTIQSKFGNYVKKGEIINDLFYVKKSFELYPGKFSLKEYENFYGFFSSVYSLEKQKVILTNRR